MTVAAVPEVIGRVGGRLTVVGSVRGAEGAAGLVSVPSSLSEGRRAVEIQELADNVGAFLLTPDRKAKSRLAKLRMAVGFGARAHAVTLKGSRSDQAWMVTLTYAPGNDWRPDHVSAALHAFRLWCGREGHPLRYVWIAELQDGKRREDGKGRNVIHYHLCVWLPAGVRAPHFDRRGWWPYGMSQSLKARGAVGYLLHYLKKDKDLSGMPKGARCYGVGGLDHALRRARRWLRLPAFVQANSDCLDDWRRHKGGGWLAPGGEWFCSEFRRISVGGVPALQRVAMHPRAIEAAGPFSWASRGPACIAA